MDKAYLVVLAEKFGSVVQRFFGAIFFFDRPLPSVDDAQDLVKSFKSICFFVQRKLVAVVIELEKLCTNSVRFYNRDVFVWLPAVDCIYLFVEVLKTVYKWLNLLRTGSVSIIDHELEIGAYFGELPECLETHIQEAVEMAMLILGPEFLDHQWALKSKWQNRNLVNLWCWSTRSWTILSAWSLRVLVKRVAGLVFRTSCFWEWNFPIHTRTLIGS